MLRGRIKKKSRADKQTHMTSLRRCPRPTECLCMCVMCRGVTIVMQSVGGENTFVQCWPLKLTSENNYISQSNCGGL